MYEILISLTPELALEVKAKARLQRVTPETVIGDCVQCVLQLERSHVEYVGRETRTSPEEANAELHRRAKKQRDLFRNATAKPGENAGMANVCLGNATIDRVPPESGTSKITLTEKRETFLRDMTERENAEVELIE